MLVVTRYWFALVLAFIAGPSTGEALWQDASIALLTGENALYTPSSDGYTQTVTLEYASRYTWGDSFLFVDRTAFSGNKKSVYAELSPRVALWRRSQGRVGAVSIASTWEFGQSNDIGFNNYLLGFGADLRIPFFQYTKLNAYYRNNEGRVNNWQLSANWALPLTFGDESFLLDGFCDYESGTYQERSSLNCTSQLKWQLSKFGKSRVYLGLEYVLWYNKYGIESSGQTDERNANILLKWHL